MGLAPLLFLGGQPIAMLFVSVHPIVLFHLIFVPLSSCFFFFRCLSHSMSFLPFLRSLLKMFFLPYAYYVVAFFCLFLLFLLFLVFLFLVMYGHT